MSTQLKMLNGFLRTLVKPTLSVTKLKNIDKKRKILKKISAALPIPKDFSFLPLKFKNFDGEFVFYKNTDYTNRNVVLYFPGGAYVAGSHYSHRNITTRISKYSGAKVCAINYRKAPEYPYPFPIHDAIEAYTFLLEQGYNPKNISFSGDSAGGNLVLSTLIHIRDNTDLPLPSSAVCISPWTDMSGSGSTIVTMAYEDPMLPAFRLRTVAKLYSNGLNLKDPKISPLYANIADLPPILFHVGDKEILLSDSIDMHKKIIKQGGQSQLQIWNNAPHVFQIFANFVPQARQSIKEISYFLNEHWFENLLTFDIEEKNEFNHFGLVPEINPN